MGIKENIGDISKKTTGVVGGASLLGVGGLEIAAPFNETAADLVGPINEGVKNLIETILTQDFSVLIGPDSPLSDLGLLEAGITGGVGALGGLLTSIIGNKMGVKHFSDNIVGSLSSMAAVSGHAALGTTGLTFIVARKSLEKLFGPKYAFLAKYLAGAVTAGVASYTGLADITTGLTVLGGSLLAEGGVKTWKYAFDK